MIDLLKEITPSNLADLERVAEKGIIQCFDDDDDMALQTIDFVSYLLVDYIKENSAVLTGLTMNTSSVFTGNNTIH